MSADEGGDSDMQMSDEEVSEGAEDDLIEEASESERVVPTPPHPPLKIKLKLPAIASSIASVSERAPSRDIESEDEDEDEEGGYEDEDEVEQELDTPTSSVDPRPRRVKHLTARQAVLASVVDSSHVDLSSVASDTTSSKKKKPLNDAELALRKEETARKRRNMTEKRLADEKAETINRLLKKQSRPKNKRAAALASALSTAAPSTSAVSRASSAVPPDGEEDEDGSGHGSEEVKLEEPSMYRWVSSVRDVDGRKEMEIGFSVPLAVLPQPPEDAMDVDTQTLCSPLKPTPTPRCDVRGCAEIRKYRLVKDWARGACGMPHLQVLESEASI